MRRGSITVFAALAFMLVASFLFALLEAGRVYMLDAYADMTSELGVESVCAEYQPALWQDYRLLCLDGAYGGDTFSTDYVSAVLGARIRRNTEWENGSRIMRLTLTDARLEEYQLLTDGDGSVFLSHVADYMKKNLPVEAAQILRDRYEAGDAVARSEQTEGSIEAAQNAIEEAKREEAEKRRQEAEAVPRAGHQPKAMEVDAGGIEAVAYDGENPLEVALGLKQNAFLEMVTEGSGVVSALHVEEPEMLEKRIREVGSVSQISETDWYDRVLVLEYLDHYFADYGNAKADHALSYEMEYVLCGKESDRDNLEGAAKRLMLVREAANVTHILEDAEKREASFGMASALAGFTGNPAIIKVVQVGVVAAWAYVESILDLRALLSGAKIALLKTAEQWTTGLGSLAEAFAESARAKECADGLSYQEYLKGFLFLMNEKKLAYRMMDVMEWNLRRLPVYQNCRMDHMICRIDCRMDYAAEPVFWDFSVLGGNNPGQFTFCNNKSFSYN